MGISEDEQDVIEAENATNQTEPSSSSQQPEMAISEEGQNAQQAEDVANQTGQSAGPQ